MKELSVVIVHRLPGRVRLRLKKSPRNVNEFIEQVTAHEGLEAVQYTPITKSLLICYNPSVISSTEIIIRVSIALSLEYGNISVDITRSENHQRLTTLDYYAATALAIALTARIASWRLLAPNFVQVSQSPINRLLDYNAGISTLIAVLQHAWREVKRDGIYDPEVISVVYLVNSMLKGNYLTASAITWIATFGRHLITPAEEHCALEATEVLDAFGKPYIDVMVSPLTNGYDNRNPIKLLVISLSRLIGLNPHKEHLTLFDQVQQMSRKHGNVLEGMSHKPTPVYMRLEKATL